jgi:protoporphyrinogen oxidase
MKNYSNLIVGGGISGLYLAYKIKDKDTLLIEKNNYLGGRIYTNENKGFKYEAGAGRFGLKQKEIIELINELGLKDKIYKLPTEMSYIFNGKMIKTEKKLLAHFKVDRFKSVNEIWEFIIKSKSNYTSDFLTNNTFMIYLQAILKPNEVDLIYKSFGYITEILQQNAYATLSTLITDFDIKDKEFCVLGGGLSQLIDVLKNKIVESGIKIITECELIDLKIKSDKMKSITLQYKNKNNNVTHKYISCNKIYFTIPVHNIKNINYFKNDKILTNSVLGYPLIRIYAKYPVINNKVWFSGLNKTVVDNLIKFIIPIDDAKGLIMISYSDSYISEFWNSLKSKKTVIKYLQKYLSELFPQLEIPEPQWITLHNWKYGCTYWKPGYNYDMVLKHINTNYVPENIFILGESYSRNPAWINSSLDAINKIL